MGNRLARDQILNRALDMVDSSSLDQKDRPGGVLHANAMCIGWLQDALDLFHRTFPWRGLITSSALSITSSTDTYALPADFEMDVRDGVRIVQSSPLIRRRLARQPFTWLLNRDTAGTDGTRGLPACYVILNSNLRLSPWPDTTYTGELWYYKLPEALAAADRPTFPDDWMLVEYVRLRGKEWINEESAGTAIAYARKVIGELKKSGLGEEAENDSLMLDPTRFRPMGNDPGSSTAWLGDSVAH